MTDTRTDTPVIDLRYTHHVQKHGGIVATLTWNRHSGKGCLVLLPASSRHIANGERPIPCIVNEADAWKWSDSIGDWSHQETVGAMFAAVLGLPPHQQSIFTVIGVIRDYTGELAMMPPMPDWGEKIVADVIAVDQDGKETHTEVRDHV